MKRVCLARWSGQLLVARPSGPLASTLAFATAPLPRTQQHAPVRRQPWSPARRQQHTDTSASPEIVFEDSAAAQPPFPSPPPERALSSAKLAALHARLSLSDKIPLQTLARALVDPSADSDPRFNNSNLAYLGSALLNYHATEWLVCHYPRLPFAVIVQAVRGYAGSESLAQVARSWGVESAAEPGDEVDPGLLQFSVTRPRGVMTRWGYRRGHAEQLQRSNWRHSINSRVVMDDEFGDIIPPASKEGTSEDAAGAGGLPEVRVDKRLLAQDVHADLVRAVVGATYAHCGRAAAASFVKAHVLSRHMDLASLFGFKLPTRELATLCAREGFEPPVARLLSETGRTSRTPVFVVGIFSGNDKVGEGAGATPGEARDVAAMNALKAWYLYSPGPQTRVPSDMLVEGAKPWEPAYVDSGEVI